MDSTPIHQTRRRGRAARLLTRGVALLGATLLLGITACSDDAEDAAPPAEDRTTSGTSTETSAPPADPLLLPTDLGDVQGVDSAVEGVRAFHAMPYAAEPTGENRWRPPQPRDPYDGTFEATAPGASCPQMVEGVVGQFTITPDPAEDCLTVSVWSPDDAADLPVMVWFHGGGLQSGSAEQPLYIGDNLAARGVVVVGANYRLGPFGYLATEELAAESDDGSVGNYGLADQRAALEWVQRNIAAFGGDPENVTIFGESAGGFSACGHLASPASEDLFDKAIIQSGGGCDRLQSRDDALAAGAALLGATGCEDITCLRDLPTDQVLAAGFDPVLVADGVVLSDTASQLAERGDLDGIPVLIGSNGTEATLFTLTITEPTEEGLLELFAEMSDQPEELLALYPAEQYENNLERYRTMWTDAVFACPTLGFAETATNDTFVYHYVYRSPSDPFGFGPTHGAELPPLFGHPEGIRGLEAGLSDPETKQVSEQMQAAWVAFATTGDPGEVWVPYADGQQITQMDAEFTLVDEIRGGRCKAVLELTDAAA
ncbi:MAG: carboxylesterase family protein [Acidimicrobiales bacterium]|jgi:para-nitrobenzyl esterase|nr:carboxylesterase family protein [Acidimicrobiales bacterium]